MQPNPKNIQGLNTSEIAISRETNGTNTTESGEPRLLLHVFKEIVFQPMFILLLAACLIYFFVGRSSDGIIMLVSIFIVSGISLYQEYRSQDAVNALKKLSAPKSTVIRDGMQIKIPTEEIVVDDIVVLEEGEIISADGLIISSHDFFINESILTGESLPVNKTSENDDKVYKGTQVFSGNAIIKVFAVGNKTMLGKIGLSIKAINILKTPLQQQINSFVRIMVWIGAIAFIIVVVYHYLQSGNIVQSFLQGLTLAMSILPEEIPVAFTTFQALGAFRLLRNNIIVKQPQYVETLGSATVICVDKTGTLTENNMSIAYVYDAINKISLSVENKKELPRKLIEYAMWSSETDPFDPMEKAIHELYAQTSGADKRLQYEQVHEYPVSGKPPMMTHIFKNHSNEFIIAAKGGPEALLKKSNLSVEQTDKIQQQLQSYAQEGFRVLGIGKGVWQEKTWPVSQEEFDIQFLGLIAFYDPPKAKIEETLKTFNDAGISVKMLTGDYPETSMAIAHLIKLDKSSKYITGKQVTHFSKEELKKQVKETNVFARMFPEAKLGVINALIENGEVVAMTGDGVNDAPALRAAHIGIAMGERGSEVAKNTASLVITDDDLSHLTEAVALGRKIYDNLKKAIQYIVSIHIPIILIVTLPLLLGWKFNEIFTPIHVIFLELIMGPTCSIIYENEPMEPGTMLRLPRRLSSTFLSGKQLQISIVQGLMITAGCLGIGYYFTKLQQSESMVRTSIFITLLFCNIFLTLSNRSFRYTIFKTIRYKNYLIPFMITVTLLFIISLLYIPFFRNLFLLTRVSEMDVAIFIIVALISTLWIEILKFIKQIREKNPG
ncbi:cation-translocating P-type ATPase [Ginsengibacter hankyongi]|uniref:Cation-translocating P-type ATPase n=1 Tax=Ginsengibacter hankyongi TaxID=2607284 RepID=A0A5J5ILW0_9BACT|nr:cation-translocating P-type ATPase [Ginsengibacter hankyongi]KAA9041097.1 cation-translocating P-type ATPase [Ginsengibacter hankyongi]